MSRTRAQVKKQSKKKAKEKKKTKATNIRKHQAPYKWVLTVLLDGKWLEARRFRKWEQVEAHKIETERRRKDGEIIVPGRVYSIETGNEVMSIKGSDVKGMLPDKLDGKESSDEKTKPGFLKKLVSKD